MTQRGVQAKGNRPQFDLAGSSSYRGSIVRHTCVKWFSQERCLVTALKKFLSAWMHGGTLVASKVLGGFFVSSENDSFPDGSGRKFETME